MREAQFAPFVGQVVGRNQFLKTIRPIYFVTSIGLFFKAFSKTTQLPVGL